MRLACFHFSALFPNESRSLVVLGVKECKDLKGILESRSRCTWTYSKVATGQIGTGCSDGKRAAPKGLRPSLGDRWLQKGHFQSKLMSDNLGTSK